PEIGAVLAAIALRDRKAQMARLIGAVLGLAQQRLPFVPRQPAIVEIGARPFAAVIEEADVVISLFERLDRARDEAVEFVEIGGEVGRQVEIQGATPLALFVVVAIEAGEDARQASQGGCGAASGCVIEWYEAACGG